MQKYLKFEYFGEFKTKIENNLMVYEDLRWALLVKELKPKILCKCTFWYTFSVCKCPGVLVSEVLTELYG